MRSNAKLRAVPDAPVEAVDVHALLLADIRARNWDGVHIAAGRRQPVHLPDPVRRGWR